MLEITLLKKPYEVSLSGNPITFAFALSPYGAVEQAQDIRLQIRILVELAFGSGIFNEVKTQNFYPQANGQISMAVQTILDPYLDFYLPRLTQVRAVQAQEQRKRFKISWLLQKDGAVVSGPNESQIYSVVKSGLNYESWHPSEFFSNKIVGEKLPLLYKAAGEKCGINEIKYLFWIYPYADNANQVVTYKLYLNDGTTISGDFPNVFGGKWGVFCTPAGYIQSGIANMVTAGLSTIKYSITVMAGSITIVDEYFYEIDHRNFYEPYQLLYRNSIGGLESIRLRGQVDFSADYDRQLAQKTVPPNWYSNLNLLPQSTDESTEELTSFSGDTGFISKPAMEKIRDLFLSKQKLQVQNGKLIPININTKKAKFYSNKDSLLSTVIEWSPAFGNSFFTPQNYMPNGRSCPAVQTFVVKQISRTKLQIMYALEEPYDTIQVQIIIGATTYLYVYTGNTKTVIQNFANPATTTPVTIVVKGRTACDDENNEYGPFTTLNVTVTGNSLPIANNDYYTINSGYSSSVVLSPSALANDYDPDGDPIEAIVASGATNAGGAYSITASGVVTYTPPNSWYVGNDYFDYQIHEIGSATNVTGRVHINVGGSVAAGVYAKIVIVNPVYSSSQYEVRSEGDVYVYFYSNPAGTIPLNITSLGLTINLQDTFTQQAVPTTTIYDLTRAGTGTRMLLYSGTIYYSLFDPIGGETFYQHLIEVLAGTGYVVI